MADESNNILNGQRASILRQSNPSERKKKERCSVRFKKEKQMYYMKPDTPVHHGAEICYLMSDESDGHVGDNQENDSSMQSGMKYPGADAYWDRLLGLGRKSGPIDGGNGIVMDVNDSFTPARGTSPQTSPRSELWKANSGTIFASAMVGDMTCDHSIPARDDTVIDVPNRWEHNTNTASKIDKTNSTTLSRSSTVLRNTEADRTGESGSINVSNIERHKRDAIVEAQCDIPDDNMANNDGSVLDNTCRGKLVDSDACITVLNKNNGGEPDKSVNSPLAGCNFHGQIESVSRKELTPMLPPINVDVDEELDTENWTGTTSPLTNISNNMPPDDMIAPSLSFTRPPSAFTPMKAYMDALPVDYSAVDRQDVEREKMCSYDLSKGIFSQKSDEQVSYKPVAQTKRTSFIPMTELVTKHEEIMNKEWDVDTKEYSQANSSVRKSAGKMKGTETAPRERLRSTPTKIVPEDANVRLIIDSPSKPQFLGTPSRTHPRRTVEKDINLDKTVISWCNKILQNQAEENTVHESTNGLSTTSTLSKRADVKERNETNGAVCSDKTKESEKVGCKTKQDPPLIPDEQVLDEISLELQAQITWFDKNNVVPWAAVVEQFDLYVSDMVGIDTPEFWTEPPKSVIEALSLWNGSTNQEILDVLNIDCIIKRFSYPERPDGDLEQSRYNYRYRDDNELKEHIYLVAYTQAWSDVMLTAVQQGCAALSQFQFRVDDENVKNAEPLKILLDMGDLMNHVNIMLLITGGSTEYENWAKFCKDDARLRRWDRIQDMVAIYPSSLENVTSKALLNALITRGQKAYNNLCKYARRLRKRIEKQNRRAMCQWNLLSAKFNKRYDDLFHEYADTVIEYLKQQLSRLESVGCAIKMYQKLSKNISDQNTRRRLDTKHSEDMHKVFVDNRRQLLESYLDMSNEMNWIETKSCNALNTLVKSALALIEVYQSAVQLVGHVIPDFLPQYGQSSITTFAYGASVQDTDEPGGGIDTSVSWLSLWKTPERLCLEPSDLCLMIQVPEIEEIMRIFSEHIEPNLNIFESLITATKYAGRVSSAPVSGDVTEELKKMLYDDEKHCITHMKIPKNGGVDRLQKALLVMQKCHSNCSGLMNTLSSRVRTVLPLILRGIYKMKDCRNLKTVRCRDCYPSREFAPSVNRNYIDAGDTDGARRVVEPDVLHCRIDLQWTVKHSDTHRLYYQNDEICKLIVNKEYLGIRVIFAESQVTMHKDSDVLHIDKTSLLDSVAITEADLYMYRRMLAVMETIISMFAHRLLKERNMSLVTAKKSAYDEDTHIGNVSEIAPRVARMANMGVAVVTKCRTEIRYLLASAHLMSLSYQTSPLIMGVPTKDILKLQLLLKRNECQVMYKLSVQFDISQCLALGGDLVFGVLVDTIAVEPFDVHFASEAKAVETRIVSFFNKLFDPEGCIGVDVGLGMQLSSDFVFYRLLLVIMEEV